MKHLQVKDVEDIYEYKFSMDCGHVSKLSHDAIPEYKLREFEDKGMMCYQCENRPMRKALHTQEKHTIIIVRDLEDE